MRFASKEARIRAHLLCENIDWLHRLFSDSQPLDFNTCALKMSTVMSMRDLPPENAERYALAVLAADHEATQDFESIIAYFHLRIARNSRSSRAQ